MKNHRDTTSHQADSASKRELEGLLAESVEDATQRAFETFDRNSIPNCENLILCGAGGLGRRTLAGLKSLGMVPIAFTDNNVSLHGTTVDGVLVLPPREAAARFGRSATFVVTIWRAGGSHRYGATRRQLTELGCSNVVSFAALYWKYFEVFLPYYCQDVPAKIIRQASAVRAGYDLWGDDQSRQEYVDQVRWRLALDFEGLTSPVGQEQYFAADLISLSDSEVFVDAGAYNGDTFRSFTELTANKFEHYWAFEPDPINYRALQNLIEHWPADLQAKVTCVEAAVGSSQKTILIEPTGTVSSATGHGSVEVPCVRLDDTLSGSSPTFLKLDIEGAEPDALIGARRIIETYAPIVTVCVYHQQDHLWRLPLYINSISDKYSYFLRPHNEEGWDLVCYAIPHSRLRKT